MLPLYWLAGVRWDSLRQHPEPERERIAVLGSSVLIPTTLAFFGMYFYASHRVRGTGALICLPVSAIWALIIMNVDRILLATYRPFQLWHRKLPQVVFRIGLASVVSTAITLPFCLDQYRSAIVYRYKTELQERANTLSAEQERERREIEEKYVAERERDSQQLQDLQKAPIDPESYAEGKIVQEEKSISDPQFFPPPSEQTMSFQTQMEVHKEQLTKAQQQLADEQRIHEHLVEAMAREKRGQPNEFYPEPKESGRGARFRDLEDRDKHAITDIARLETTVSTESEALAAAEKEFAGGQLVDRNTYSEKILSHRDAYVLEAREAERAREQRLDELRRALDRIENERTSALQATERYTSLINVYTGKMEGILDPMEETIGLYKVIFVPPPDADSLERSEQRFKWMAGLFQFLVIFGTLFILDLIAILAKVFSPPGTYDAFVEFREFVASQNLRAFEREYPRFAMEWAQGRLDGYGRDGVSQSDGIALNDSAGLAAMLLRSHAPSPNQVEDKPAAVTARAFSGGDGSTIGAPQSSES